MCFRSKLRVGWKCFGTGELRMFLLKVKVKRK